MVNECEKAAAARGTWTVLTDTGVVRERREIGVLGQFSLLQASDQNGLGVEEGKKLLLSVENAIAIKLQDSPHLVGGRRGREGRGPVGG